MESDLKQECAPLSPGLHMRLASLSQHTIDRKEAETWASRSLKFLVYDDTDERINGYDSDDEQGMTEFAMKVSMGSTATDAKEKNHSKVAGHETSGVHKDGGPSAENSADANDSKCEICSSCPEFPHNRKIRKFRLFKPFDDLPGRFRNDDRSASRSICPHYVAVSYCWPPEVDSAQRKDGSDDARITYQVRDLDGTIRRSRTLDDVLDRAIDVANEFRLRMIWIDQECLPQPTADRREDERHEHQLGVQAMDIVYHRAIVTAGLHDVTVTDPLQIPALFSIMDINWNMGPPRLNGDLMNSLLNLIEAITHDRWNSRAWVVQEALSAGSGLLIVLRRGRGIPEPPRFQTNSSRFGGIPEHTLDNNPRGMPSEVICIPGDKLRGVVQNTKFLIERIFASLGMALYQFDIHVANVRQRAGLILASAEALYPALAVAGDQTVLSLVSGFNYGHRRTVDAAGALTFLNTRECRYQEDRIAILANMCGYDVRLDTRAVAAGGSLREGLLALTLLNGDLSLLVPEAYTDSGSVLVDLNDSSQHSGSKMISPFDNHAHQINHVSPRNFNLPRLLVPPRLTKGGITLAAYVWQVK
ncbi:hypothetical protein F5Y10DRAFT_290664 [Nemania abortiva]|nr:hypothetical protein F5Y10DRAFT_290664 [Nemania abortiva]